MPQYVPHRVIGGDYFKEGIRQCSGGGKRRHHCAIKLQIRLQQPHEALYASPQPTLASSKSDYPNLPYGESAHTLVNKGRRRS